MIYDYDHEIPVKRLQRPNAVTAVLPRHEMKRISSAGMVNVAIQTDLQCMF